MAEGVAAGAVEDDIAGDGKDEAPCNGGEATGVFDIGTGAFSRSLVGCRFGRAPGGKSGRGVSGAGVGCELLIECALDLLEPGRDSDCTVGCLCNGGGSLASSATELDLDLDAGLDFRDKFEGCECRALARLSDIVDLCVCDLGIEELEEAGCS